jgi:hypothetical protein
MSNPTRHPSILLTLMTLGAATLSRSYALCRFLHHYSFEYHIFSSSFRNTNHALLVSDGVTRCCSWIQDTQETHFSKWQLVPQPHQFTALPFCKMPKMSWIISLGLYEKWQNIRNMQKTGLREHEVLGLLPSDYTGIILYTALSINYATI